MVSSLRGTVDASSRQALSVQYSSPVCVIDTTGVGLPTLVVALDPQSQSSLMQLVTQFEAALRAGGGDFFIASHSSC
jgi:hypothetical protein